MAEPVEVGGDDVPDAAQAVLVVRVDADRQACRVGVQTAAAARGERDDTVRIGPVGPGTHPGPGPASAVAADVVREPGRSGMPGTALWRRVLGRPADRRSVA